MSSMNDHAALYEQLLCYRKGSTPYVCLTLPWWVMAPYPIYGPWHSCKIEPLICGEEVFQRIAGDLRRATDSVDIITWGFDPGMVLERGATAEAGQRYGDLLIEIATRKINPVHVRLLVWHDSALTQFLMKNIPGYYGRSAPSIGSARAGYYSEAHQGYNSWWFEQVYSKKVPKISFYVRSISPTLLDRSLTNETYPPGLMGKATAAFATHHQKMILIDYEQPARAVGYVMGHNSITDFWDTKEHVFQDPRRERFYEREPAATEAESWKQGPSLDPGGNVGSAYTPPEHMLREKDRARQAYMDANSHFRVSKPYQDVSCRLEGRVLFDLNHNFCQAWSESVLPGSDSGGWPSLVTRVLPTAAAERINRALHDMNSLLKGEADPSFIARRKKLGPNEFVVKDGAHSVQLMRTQPLHGEKVIKECYANLTRQIHHYMFIQNQYIQYEPWADHLMACVSRLRPILPS